MNYCAPCAISCLIDNSYICDCHIVCLVFKPPPICPKCCTYTFISEKICYFVSFYSMMKSRNFISKFFANIDHCGHFICPVAMIMNQNFSVEHTCQSLVSYVSVTRIPFKLLFIIFCTNPSIPIASNIAHSC